MGAVHARHYRNMTDVDLVFFDPDPERADDFSNRFRADACGSVESLISSVDVVDVCLPTYLHAELALQSIRAGKATFIEKPLAMTMAESRQLIAEAKGVTVGVGHVVRYFREYRTAHNAIKRGDIGNVASIRMRRGGLAPKGGVGWFMDHRLSGGVIVDLAIHEFDWIRWTFGEVTNVYAKSIKSATQEGPDYALTTLSLASGAVAHVEATWMDPSGFRATFDICGSAGVLQHDSREASSLKTHRPGQSFNESPLDPAHDPFYNQLRDFLDCVEEGKDVPVSLEDGARSLAVALAAWESTKTGEPVVPEPL